MSASSSIGLHVAGAVSCVALGILLERRHRSRHRRRGTELHSLAVRTCELRWGTAGDAPLILSMIRGLAEFEKQPHVVRLTEARLREDFIDGYFECLLAESCGNSLGFAFFHSKYSTATGRSIYLHDLYVVPAARRTGVGLALLRGVAAAAHSRRCTALHWSAFDWNEKAIGFYKSATVGAQEVSTTVCRPKEPTTHQATSLINFVLDADGIARLKR